jgi:hypothetical protein
VHGESNRANVCLEPLDLFPNVGYLIGARRLALGDKSLEALRHVEALRDLCPPVERLEDGLAGNNGIEIPTTKATATKKRARINRRLAPRDEALIVGKASSDRTSSCERAALERKERRLSFLLADNCDRHVTSGGGDDLRELGPEERTPQ